MKKLLFIFILASFIGCKQSETETPENAETQDSVATANDSVKKIKSKTLDQLLNEYNLIKNKSLESTDLYKNVLLQAIIIDSEREIGIGNFTKMLSDFWGANCTDVANCQEEIDITDLKQKLSKVTNEKYLQFAVTSQKITSDLEYELVVNHSFNSTKSCYPIPFIEKILSDPDFDKLYVTKGEVDLNTPTYKGKFNIAVLVYHDTKGHTQYFDIVHDPTKL